ncbi:uncharacterized protein LOC144135481 [Amblyomma americanum]
MTPVIDLTQTRQTTTRQTATQKPATPLTTIPSTSTQATTTPTTTTTTATTVTTTTTMTTTSTTTRRTTTTSTSTTTTTTTTRPTTTGTTTTRTTTTATTSTIPTTTTTRPTTPSTTTTRRTTTTSPSTTTTTTTRPTTTSTTTTRRTTTTSTSTTTTTTTTRPTTSSTTTTRKTTTASTSTTPTTTTTRPTTPSTTTSRKTTTTSTSTTPTTTTTRPTTPSTTTTRKTTTASTSTTPTTTTTRPTTPSTTTSRKTTTTSTSTTTTTTTRPTTTSTTTTRRTTTTSPSTTTTTTTTSTTTTRRTTTTSPSTTTTTTTTSTTTTRRTTTTSTSTTTTTTTTRPTTTSTTTASTTTARAAPPSTGPVKELVCTVGHSAVAQSMYPPDRYCDYLFYTEVVVSGQTLQASRVEASWQMFQQVARSYSRVKPGVAFDYGRTSVQSIQDASGSLAVLQQNNIRHYAILNAFVRNARQEYPNLLQTIYAMKTLQGGDQTRKTVLAVGLHDYSVQNGVSFLRTLTTLLSVPLADIVIAISSSGRLQSGADCIAAPPVSFKSRNPRFPSVRDLTVVARTGAAYNSSLAIAGLSYQLGAIVYQLSSDAPDVASIPYAQCVQSNITSMDVICRHGPPQPVEPVPTIDVFVGKVKSTQAVGGYLTPNDRKNVFLSENGLGFNALLFDLASDGIQFRSRTAWLLFDVHLHSPSCTPDLLKTLCESYKHAGPDVFSC